MKLALWLTRSACLNPLREFIPLLVPGVTVQPHQENLCAFLDEITRGAAQHRILIERPPVECAITSLFLAAACHRVLRNPEGDILYGARSQEETLRGLRRIASLCGPALIPSAFPSAYTTQERGRLHAAPPGAPLTGRGIDLAFVDPFGREAIDELHAAPRFGWLQNVVLTRMNVGGSIVVVVPAGQARPAELFEGWHHLTITAPERGTTP